MVFPANRAKRSIAAYDNAAMLLAVGALAGRADDDHPGVRHFVDPKGLPEPYATRSTISVPRIPPPTAALPAAALIRRLHVPPGFRISLFAERLTHPRWMTVAPNGDVFVVESRIEAAIPNQPHRVTVLRDTDGDGRAEPPSLFTDQLTLPLGIAFHGDYLYVANTGSIVRFHYKNGQTKAEGVPERILGGIPELGYRQHWTRNIAFSPDGKTLYLTVGSIENADEESAPRASVLACPLTPDGRIVSPRPPLLPWRIVTNGMRNPVGLDFHPTSGQLWTTVNERDYLGDDLVPDFLTEVKPGGFYGWPWYYITPAHRDPRLTDHRPERQRRAHPVTTPDVLFAAHSAPLGLVFYNATQFPLEYRGDAFIALHGSANRRRRTGYKVVRVRMDANGRPRDGGAYEDFATGWMSNPESRAVFGRPTGLAIAHDGSLLIADDAAGRIWRIQYTGQER